MTFDYVAHIAAGITSIHYNKQGKRGIETDINRKPETNKWLQRIRESTNDLESTLRTGTACLHSEACLPEKGKDFRNELRTNWIAQAPVSHDHGIDVKRTTHGKILPAGLPRSFIKCNEQIVLPTRNSVLIEIYFILTSPWYAKSEEVFGPIDNLCSKDYLTGLPMVRPSAWKGNFRKMLEKRLPALKSDQVDQKKLSDSTNSLFGPENNKLDVSEKWEGRLIFYPTYFNKIEGEIICPHDREKGIARNPIPYEIVPANTRGILKALYFPYDLVGRDERMKTILSDLYFAIKEVAQLLEYSGFSAKKTLGWGLAKIERVLLTPGIEAEPLIVKRNEWGMDDFPVDEPQTFEFPGIAEVLKDIGRMEKENEPA